MPADSAGYNTSMEASAYRIIDANFNRAREGLRTVEEYARFVIGSTPLSARAKELRHRLCAAATAFDRGRLLASRDSEADVGRGTVVPGQLARTEAQDWLIAAARRLTEALRVLAEVSLTLNSDAAQAFETLRFDVYTLEKDIALFADGAARFAKVRLYVLVTVGPQTGDDWFARTVQQCIAGGADCLQLRAKGISDDRAMRLARDLAGVCRAAGVLSIVNDRVDIALAAAADGVHLGQGDLDIKDARRLLTRPMVVGLTTHNASQLQEAIELLPTYVSLGPVFTTPTKPNEPMVGLPYVRYGVTALSGTGIGHVAIGGINAGNIDAVTAAGARAIAVSSAVLEAADPQAACRQLKGGLSARP